MRVVGNIASDSEVVATASGAITAGKPVVVNADGTVKFAGPTSTTISAGIGSEVTFESAEARPEGGAFDSNSNKVVITYVDSGNSSYGTAIVGTIDDSDNSISFGTAVVFNSAGTDQIDSTFDSSNNKVVIAYRNYGSGGHGQAIVGTVSGTSISFGSATSFFSNSNGTSYISISFDTNVNKVLIAYSDNIKDGYGIAGTVSGTDISFGSAHRFETDQVYYLKSAFDSSSNTHVAVFVNYSNSQYGEGCVLQVASDGTVSSQTPVVYESSEVQKSDIAFDTTNNKFLVAFRQSASSGRGTGIVATVSGTTLSFGTKNDWNSSQTQTPAMVFNDASGTFVILYDEGSGTDIKYIEATISGTSVTFGSAAVADTDGSTDYNAAIFDSNLKRTVLIYQDSGESSYGKARVLASAATFNVDSLTSENFIGFAKDNVADGAVATIQTANSIARDNIGEPATLSAGSAAVYESAVASQTNIAFVPSANKFVIVYQDEGNSSYGTAVVATISGTSVTYGSPTVFNSDYAGNLDITVDTNVDRIAISYTSSTSSNTGKMIIGAVSGTSLSFGSTADFNNNTVSTGVAFDSSNNKVVVAYEDDANSDYTAARVATIDSSDNSVTFGTEVNVEEANTAYQRIVFDSNSNKVVVAYRHYDGSAYSGRAKVGTVSGTNISFGSSTTFHSGNFSQPDIEFDSSNNKVVIVYANEASSAVGTAIVGTVSGTSISFGSAVVFNNGDTSTMGLTFNTTQNHFVIAYRDQGDSNKLNAIIGTVDGTSISFGTEASLTSGAALWIKCAYDSNADKVLVSYQDGANSDYGTAIVATASTDLTIGQTYFVQTDGTLSTSADDPSVIAGTAISGTDLIVKG